MGKFDLIGIILPAEYRGSDLDTVDYSASAMEIAWEAIKVHEGYDYVHEYDVERFFRDTKTLEIVEGTCEIQRLIIPREIFKHKMTL